MAQARIELKLGNNQLSAEAEESWLEKQLDKVLDYVRNVDPLVGSEKDSEVHTMAARSAPVGT